MNYKTEEFFQDIHHLSAFYTILGYEATMILLSNASKLDGELIKSLIIFSRFGSDGGVFVFIGKKI